MSVQEQMLESPKDDMKKVRLEKVILSCSSTGHDLEKSRDLLEFLTGKKAQIIKAGPKRRIPAFGVKPGLEIGTRVTLRGKEATEILKRLLGAIDNSLDESQINENTFSFGIKEYIEIPRVEYKREIGIRGLSVTVVFCRAGFRTKRKKIRRGKIPRRHYVSRDEIISFMEGNFDTEIE